MEENKGISIEDYAVLKYKVSEHDKQLKELSSTTSEIKGILHQQDITSIEMKNDIKSIKDSMSMVTENVSKEVKSYINDLAKDFELERKNNEEWQKQFEQYKKEKYEEDIRPKKFLQQFKENVYMKIGLVIIVGMFLCILVLAITQGYIK